ncbi:response regulator transcription factor [Dyadobacter sp. LHD-138]|uniref:response regulator transcription factor n=1 Tax=Dyadobacter sp. LHD-138 TaxID=3071413 RepID=UPI0027E15198|nr:response regulator transcription factor [Dyadobacter sp. LHD-138]MDQ6477951.1 response regulator transcription factor [Dyadobacter sp. LHD-138]
MTRILLSIKNDFFRMGIAASVREYAGNAYIEEINSLQNVSDSLQKSYFDLLIVEVSLSELFNPSVLDGIRLIQPQIKILIISEDNEKVLAYTYLKKGVDGVLLKSMSKYEFQSAFDTVLTGRKYAVSTRVVRRRRSKKVSSLSPRETEVMHLLLKGFRTTQICKELNLAPSTISTVKLKMYQKMEVSNVVDLMGKVNRVG